MDALRAARPASVKAYLTDDTTREIAVPSTRQRWQHVEKTLDGVPWVTLEFLDGKGKLLGQPWQNDAAATEIEDVGSGASTSKRASETAALVALMLRAQDMALQRHNEALRPILDANRIMLSDLTSQLVELRKETTRAMERERELIAALAEGAKGEDGELDLPKLMPLLPLLLGGQMQAPPAAPRPPAAAAAPRPPVNGAKNPAAPAGAAR